MDLHFVSLYTETIDFFPIRPPFNQTYDITPKFTKAAHIYILRRDLH